MELPPENQSSAEKTEAFVRQAFIDHPHFSFGDPAVMVKHSITTKNLALQIARVVEGADLEVVTIGALLHDIGKTYPADSDTLHTEHESYNLTVSERFLNELDLNEEQLAAVKAVISYQSDTPEMRIIKDADAVALYADKRLYMLFIEWAAKEKLDWAIKRKLDKFDSLNFEISKTIAQPLLLQMQHDWDEYQRSH